ncbi:MAG: nucleotide exchange factor GrpE [Anaerolineae bacterium]
MSDPLRIDDEFIPLPPSAADADPAATMRELFFRISRLEHGMEEQRVQAATDLGEVLVEVASLTDDIHRIVERWGVSRNAQEAAMVRAVVALGRKVGKILEYHKVQPLQVVGKVADPDMCEVVESEPRGNLPPGTVLREVLTGYAWPNGLLRRARVVVSSKREQHEAAGGDGAQGSQA